MIEKLFFNLVATALFIIIFFIMARKNNTTYISLLVIEAIGIAINFLEINFNIFVQWPFKVIEYIFSIILPIIVLFLERKNIIKYPEIIALIMNRYYHKRIGIDIPLFWKNIIHMMPSAFILIVLAEIFQINVSLEYSWLYFTIKVVIYTLIYMILIYLIGMNDYEKNLCRSVIFKMIGRK